MSAPSAAPPSCPADAHEAWAAQCSYCAPRAAHASPLPGQAAFAAQAARSDALAAARFSAARSMSSWAGYGRQPRVRRWRDRETRFSHVCSMTREPLRAVQCGTPAPPGRSIPVGSARPWIRSSTLRNLRWNAARSSHCDDEWWLWPDYVILVWLVLALAATVGWTAAPAKS